MSSGREGTLYSVHPLEAQSTKLSPHTTALCGQHQRGTPCILERRVSTIAHFQAFETRNISKYIFDFLPVCASDFGALPSKVLLARAKLGKLQGYLSARGTRK